MNNISNDESKRSLSVEQRLEVVESLSELLTGKLDQEIIDDARKKILEKRAISLKAKLTITSFIFYHKHFLEIDDLKEFFGTSGGVTTLGIGAYFGNFHTDDIDKVYAEGLDFTTITTAFAGTMQIWSIKDRKLLGHFEGIGAGTTLGTSGGSGYWR
ncbi:VapA/VapB family virulence-associated protein [Xenorhabdus anantnagensis]|uniref:VapA/VapB family virulence-associated protein n=1 Tax=Xenorhabdus anantnagensis TaxID=3025875 RepID=A0ABT5LMY8_9GAMM|nr:VapA/VapB family virulence-associated protein [Xenorhabdus anantnagensis]MDC9595777.1 VapA/VapB family virulence-associated protein [Xenorhabdus anantnagensis]